MGQPIDNSSTVDDSVILSSSPASVNRSPTKSRNTSPLPPINTSIQISKKRRLEASSPIGADGLSTYSHELPDTVGIGTGITPSKMRSVSSPTRLQQKRTPSLTDRPIPVLSPPSLSQESPASFSISKSTPAVSKESEIPSSSSSATSDTLVTRNASSPLQSKSSLNQNSSMPALYRKESELNKEIQRWKQLVNIAEQAQKYDKSDKFKEIEHLLESWRLAAQGAAAYLYNQARTKVNMMGGIDELKRRMQEQKQISGIIADDIDYDQLSQDEKLMFDEMKDEYDRLAERESQTTEQDETEDREFTMSFMLKTLNIQPSLLFPDGCD